MSTGIQPLCRDIQQFLEISTRVADFLRRPEHFSGNARLVILIASQVRSRQLIKAILSLSADEFVEEIACLNRCLAELVINAIYLQFAEVEEVERFKHFDTLAGSKMLGELSKRMTAQDALQLKADLDGSDYQRVIQDAEAAIGAVAGERSWSRRSVLDRAISTNRHFRDSCLLDVFNLAYLTGHSSVHCTWTSLTSNQNWRHVSQSGEAKSPGEPLHVSLQATFVSIVSLSKYLAHVAQLADPELTAL